MTLVLVSRPQDHQDQDQLFVIKIKTKTIKFKTTPKASKQRPKGKAGGDGP